ncbi:MAG TPA: hypothetical protein VHO24_04725 [Opitutaceae bacterium]|nr:hypothetical protein [Opitutaceae bacterium]
MIKRPVTLCVFLLLSSALALAQKTIGSSGAPAENWEMKIFTKEGYRSMILRGTEVRVAGANRYDVVDLSITNFSGDQASRVDSILLSPAASFFAKENRAQGDKSVRLIRDDMEIAGEQWTFHHFPPTATNGAHQKVSIQRNTRVVFHAALPDLLR